MVVWNVLIYLKNSERVFDDNPIIQFNFIFQNRRNIIWLFSICNNVKFTKYINLGLILPEIEYEKEINYEINFDIKPSVIDSWTSNKAKMLNKCEPKEIPITPQKKEQISQISPKNWKEKNSKKK